MSSACRVCERQAVPGSPYCDRCRKLRNRPELRPGPDGGKRRIDKYAREAAMKDACRDGIFHCYFTDLALTDRYPHPLYATWEHLTPTNESRVVLAADFVNKMKGNLTEDEFKAVVTALARRFDTGADFDASLISRLADEYDEEVIATQPPADRFIWGTEDVIIICAACRQPVGEPNEDCPTPEQHA